MRAGRRAPRCRMILARRMIFLPPRARRAMRRLTPACPGLVGPARAKVRASQPSPPPPSGSTGLATEGLRRHAYGDGGSGLGADRRDRHDPCRRHLRPTEAAHSRRPRHDVFFAAYARRTRHVRCGPGYSDDQSARGVSDLRTVLPDRPEAGILVGVPGLVEAAQWATGHAGRESFVTVHSRRARRVRNVRHSANFVVLGGVQPAVERSVS